MQTAHQDPATLPLPNVDPLDFTRTDHADKANGVQHM